MQRWFAEVQRCIGVAVAAEVVHKEWCAEVVCSRGADMEVLRWSRGGQEGFVFR